MEAQAFMIIMIGTCAKLKKTTLSRDHIDSVREIGEYFSMSCPSRPLVRAMFGDTSMMTLSEESIVSPQNSPKTSLHR